MVARILAQLMDAVRQALEPQCKFEGVRYWTDGKTVLCWSSNTCSWKQFVQDRVDEILRVSSKCDWCHCPGIENRKGPTWLKGTPIDWPNLETLRPSLEIRWKRKIL